MRIAIVWTAAAFLGSCGVLTSLMAQDITMAAAFFFLSAVIISAVLVMALRQAGKGQTSDSGHSCTTPRRPRRLGDGVEELRRD